MKPKKPYKPTEEDKAWQEKVEKQVMIERTQLDHPQGKEQFDRVISNALKKKPKDDKNEDLSGVHET